MVTISVAERPRTHVRLPRSRTPFHRQMLGRDLKVALTFPHRQDQLAEHSDSASDKARCRQ